MEVTTQVPQTGTKLRFDSDRQFEGQSGDSVLRVQGQRPDGGQVFDAAYVEIDPKEADATARLLRQIVAPDQSLQDRIAQEVQATFSSKLSGRDGQQIAHIVSLALQQQVSQWLGGSTTEQSRQKIERLAERLERAAGNRSNPSASYGSSQQSQQQGYGQSQQSPQSQGQQDR